MAKSKTCGTCQLFRKEGGITYCDRFKLGIQAKSKPWLEQPCCHLAKVNKMHNVWTMVDGRNFQSAAEASRYVYNRDRERRGEILKLVCQPKFQLLDKFTDWTGAQQPGVTYTADFSYTVPIHEIGHGTTWRRIVDPYQVIEDVKGDPTEKFLVQMQFFLAQHPLIHYYLVKRGRMYLPDGTEETSATILLREQGRL